MSSPRFSIIIASYLGHYPGAASNREQKLIRAINSVMNQTFTDWEVIVIADGCEKTFQLVCDHYLDNDRIKCYLISKAEMFAGAPRNVVIQQADGAFIIYLDNDDYYGSNHRGIMNGLLIGYGWVWYNDS